MSRCGGLYGTYDTRFARGALTGRANVSPSPPSPVIFLSNYRPSLSPFPPDPASLFHSPDRQLPFSDSARLSDSTAD